MKTKLKVKSGSRPNKAPKGLPSLLNVRGSANSHGTLSSAGSEVTKPGVSTNPDGSIEGGVPSRCTVIVPPASTCSLPGKVNDTPIAVLKNSTSTFRDSVLSLCMKSVTSCGDNGCLEFIFIGLVKKCGLIQAKAWADALHIPHERSYRFLYTLLYGTHDIKPECL